MKKIMLILWITIFCFEALSQSIDSTWQVENLPINSEFDEYMPFLVDTIMMFTSTRKNSREDQLFEYTEKVYYTLLADTIFGKIKKFTYKANSDANSALVGCSNNSFFFYRSYFNNDGEIFIAPRKKEVRIKIPRKFKKISSTKDENSVAVVGDSVYFTSNRDGVYNVYLQIGDEKPVILVVLNSPFDEQGVWLSPLSKKLYFSSNREGSFNIYCSQMTEGLWQSPEKLPFPVNTEFDEQDFRQYSDSVVFLASNRPGGLGAYDLYKITKAKNIEVNDTIKPVKKEPVDTVEFIINNQDSLTVREQALIELEELGLIPFRGEIQVGAFRERLRSVDLFKNHFSCVINENIRMDVFKDTDSNLAPLRKFIVDKVYTDLNSALDKQIEIIKKNCFPTTQEGTPFIALLRADKKRYAIFWKEEEYNNKEVLWITLDGEEVWRSN